MNVNASAVKAKILIAEGDPNLLDILKSLFRSLEHRVKSAIGNEPLQTALTEDTPDVLFCDMNAWMFIANDETLKKSIPPTVVMAAYAELELAEKAVKNTDAIIIPKPVRTQNAIDALDNILWAPTFTKRKKNQDNSQQPADKPSLSPKLHFNTIIGEHPDMLEIYDLIQKVAATDLTVLIRGESGTGKDLVARAIHNASPRANRPFVAINCTAVHGNLLESELFGYAKGAFTGATKAKDGLFKAADGGTIFLDEIGSVPPSMQLALLRVLQDKTVRPVGSTQTFPVDVRIISATNENLEERIKESLFREDLFFRLATFPITLPPLRKRASDIPEIARFLLENIEKTTFPQDDNRTLAISGEALETLKKYTWPGNVRELHNILQRAAAVLPPDKSTITSDCLNLEQTQNAEPDSNAKQEHEAGGEYLTLKAYLKSCERAYIQKVYEANGFDKEKTAKTLGISIGTFYRKLEE